MRIEIKLITKLSKLNISLDFFKTSWRQVCNVVFNNQVMLCSAPYSFYVSLKLLLIFGKLHKEAQNFEIVSIKNLFTCASATLSGHHINKNRWKDWNQSDKNVKVKQNFKILGGKIKITPNAKDISNLVKIYQLS